MRRVIGAVLLLLAVTGCESEERKKCFAECDKEAARANQCGGPGEAECRAAIGELADECRATCEAQTK